jgi:DNA-binding transcriptional regulator YiaG
MTNIASVLKTEIARIARKESRGDTTSLKASSARHRSELADLKRRIAELERRVKSLVKGAAQPTSLMPKESTEGLHRWRPAGFKRLRAKLGLSANDMGKLLGCSGQSVYKWEEGKARPRAAQLASIALARGLGKREAQVKLDSMGSSSSNE